MCKFMIDLFKTLNEAFRVMAEFCEFCVEFLVEEAFAMSYYLRKLTRIGRKVLFKDISILVHLSNFDKYCRRLLVNTPSSKNFEYL